MRYALGDLQVDIPFPPRMPRARFFRGSGVGIDSASCRKSWRIFAPSFSVRCVRFTRGVRCKCSGEHQTCSEYQPDGACIRAQVSMSSPLLPKRNALNCAYQNCWRRSRSRGPGPVVRTQRFRPPKRMHHRAIPRSEYRPDYFGSASGRLRGWRPRVLGISPFRNKSQFYRLIERPPGFPRT